MLTHVNAVLGAWALIQSSMFDSPLEWCRVCKEWVALDQTAEECKRQHHCRDGACPMAALLWAQRRHDEAALKRSLPLR